MRKRQQYYTRPYSDPYHQYHRGSGRRQAKPQGCFDRVITWFTNALITVLSIVAIVAAVLLFLWVVTHWQTVLAIWRTIVVVAPWIGIGIVAILAITVLLYLYYGFVNVWAKISGERAKAQLAKQQAEQAKLKSRRVSQSLEYERRVFAQQAQMSEYDLEERRRRRSTQVLPENEEYRYREERRRRRSTQILPDETDDQQQPGIPDMPQLQVRYRDYAQMVQPGELIIGVRRNGRARMGSWQDYKVVLVLGGSSSGKTTTMTQLALGAACGGGLLVVCDPHGHKEDSLLNRILPLQHCALPGTTFAIDHKDILSNLHAIKKELERRVHGADASIPVYLIVEELNRLQRDKAIASELTEILETIGQEGRGYKVYCVVGGQKVTGLSDIRKSVISFIVHRVDEAESKVCIPGRYSKYSPELKVGQTFVKDADGLTEPLVQCYINQKDVASYAAAIRPPRLPQQRQTQKVEAQRPPQRSSHAQRPPQPPQQKQPRKHTQSFYARQTERLDESSMQQQQDEDEIPTQPRRNYGAKRHVQALQKQEHLIPKQFASGAVWGEDEKLPAQGSGTLPLRSRSETTVPPQPSETSVHSIQRDHTQRKLERLSEIRGSKNKKRKTR